MVEYSVKDKRTQKIYQKVRFTTYTDPIFNCYRKLFYKKSKKILPLKIQSLFYSKLTLAVWYLDDGSLRSDSKAFRLHTNNFSIFEVEKLKDVCAEKL